MLSSTCHIESKSVRQRVLASISKCLALSAILLCGVAFADNGDFSKQYQKTAPSVVTILAGDKAGSGFSVRVPAETYWADRIVGSTKPPQTVFVTNAHVVNDDEGVTSIAGRMYQSMNQNTITIVTASNERCVGFVSYQDREEDIALIVAEFGNCEATPALSIAKDSPKPGSPVYAIGSPGIADRGNTALAVGSVTQGIVSKVWEKADIVQFDATVNHGNSGGPLVDSDGKVIGMVTRCAETPGDDPKNPERLPGVNLAISSAAINRMLNEYGQFLGNVQQKHKAKL